MERGEEHGTAESMIRDEGSHLPPLLLGDSTVLDRPLLFEKTEGDGHTKGKSLRCRVIPPTTTFQRVSREFYILQF